MDRDKKYYVLLVGFATTLATLIFGFFLLWNKIADSASMCICRRKPARIHRRRPGHSRCGDYSNA